MFFETLEAMKFRAYKDKHPFKLEQLAEKLGISLGHASDLVNGKRQASLDVAVEIEKFTKGLVTCQDLLVSPPSKKKPSASRAIA